MKLGIVMDPIEAINPTKDTSLAMLLEAQARGLTLYYMTLESLYYQNPTVFAKVKIISVKDSTTNWFSVISEETIDITDLDVILMRKDPPFDMNYIHATYLLEHAEAAGCLVVNKAQSLRDANEKMFTTWFPACCPRTLVSADKTLLKDFITSEQKAIIKPLDGMGGEGVHLVTPDLDELDIILSTLTCNYKTAIMAQQYLPEIVEGDKRIILINGEPIPYCLARIPKPGHVKANLAAGGHGVTKPLSNRDMWLCKQIAPSLKAKGLWFVGLDVIGDYITEINVTSPTCVREIDAAHDTHICGVLFDVIFDHLPSA
jgi:glutathione synthase